MNKRLKAFAKRHNILVTNFDRDELSPSDFSFSEAIKKEKKKMEKHLPTPLIMRQSGVCSSVTIRGLWCGAEELALLKALRARRSYVTYFSNSPSINRKLCSLGFRVVDRYEGMGHVTVLSLKV